MAITLSRKARAALCVPLIAAMLPVTSARAGESRGEGEDKDETRAAPPPAIYAALSDCRKIAQPDERLACFDSRVAELDTAFAKADVVIADREQIREARRGLFGLSLPDIKLFSRGGEEEEVTSIESTLESYTIMGDGKALFRLANGQRWVQTDHRILRPKAGMTVSVHRSALGSYMLRLGDAPGVRAKRLAD